MNKKLTICFAAMASATAATQASLSWTGGGDQISLYQESNWQDDNGNTPAANTINPNTAVTAATGGLIEITSGNGQPSNFGGTFNVGSGNSLTVIGKTLASGGNSPVIGGGGGTSLTLGSGATMSLGNVSNFGTINASSATVDLFNVTGATNVSVNNVTGTIRSLTMGSGTVSFVGTGPSFTNVDFTGVTGNIANMQINSGSLNISGANPTFGNLTLSNSSATVASLSSSASFPSEIYLTNGSSWESTFITNNTTLFVDGTSTMELFGSGDPINSQTNPTSVHLAYGAKLTLSSLAEFTQQGNEIFVNGVSFNSDNSVLSFNGTTATAVPEASSAALIGLAGLALILRRRK
ncbi:hypothetical protein NT6N_38110 [Oceaniferula spumae]|uniref:PEP-CTERM sorting domain-containing protein n=1 Tax=Oceaniferula spumae TaxID=2979115 RepID=A0AAT9FRW8_9BACT